MSNNTGHGRIIPRDDGIMAKCFGPAGCKECRAELASLKAEQVPSVWMDEWLKLQPPAMYAVGTGISLSGPFGEDEAVNYFYRLRGEGALPRLYRLTPVDLTTTLVHK